MGSSSPVQSVIPTRFLLRQYLRMMDRSPLRPHAPLTGTDRSVEPIEERHRDGLREAAERDPQIHRYTNMYTLGFDRWFDLALAARTRCRSSSTSTAGRSARRAI